MAVHLQAHGSRSSSRHALTREFCQVPVTALALHRSSASGLLYVLAAEDNHLRVYEAASGRPVRRFVVFPEQPIHGVSVENGHVLVWGACEMVLFSADALREDGDAPAMIYASSPDWVYGAAVSPYDASQLVIVTAHNEAIKGKLSGTGKSDLVLCDAVSPSRPILSAAHLTWLSQDCVLVAGGTFFGEILVWKYHLDRAGESAYEMLFILTGHEGSIFGMDISPPVVLGDGSTARLLASCSDDRTIRIWDITERPSNKHTRDAARSRLNEIRETGFVSSSDTEQPIGADEAAVPVAVAMGHISRIWGVRFARQRAGVRLETTIYSFGEDSTAQKWHLLLAACAKPTGDEGSGAALAVTGSLSHKQTFSLHEGKNLWSRALLDAGDRTYIAMGGADGKISLLEDDSSAADLQQAPQPGQPTPFPAHRVVTLEARDILANLASPRTLDGRKEEIVNRYDFISEHEILVTTSWGRLLRGTLQNGLQWKELGSGAADEPDFKTCYVLRGSGRGTAVMGMTTGDVYFHKANNDLVHMAKLPGKVVDIRCLGAQRSGTDSSVNHQDILIYLYGSSVGHYLTLDSVTGAIVAQEEVQGVDSRFVAVSAARIGDYLLMGSRHGFLSIAKRVNGRFSLILDTATPTRDAITSMVAIPSADSSTAPNYFVATSRDGKYRIFKIVEQADALQLQLCHETSPPFGPFIEGAWFTADARPQLIMYGFRSKSFVVWNETLREEVATIECGGAHRSFVLSHDAPGSRDFRFAFTKASKLSLYVSEGTMHKSFRASLHGREIRALSYNGRYLASGAEDTTVRIWEYVRVDDGSAEVTLRPVISIKAHVAGIQRVRWLGDEYLLSSGGNEEFFIWKLHRLDANYAGLGIVCEGVLTDKSDDADLRITDFDVCWIDGGKSMLITLGYSNTMLKAYRYEPGNGFHLIAKGMYTGACLTQVRHLGRWEHDFAVLTASTDGHLAVWEMRTETHGANTFELKSASRLHQSSIKSLDMTERADEYRVLTGGDDNALGTALIYRSPRNDGAKCDYKVKDRKIVRKAHSAAINGVLMVSHGDTEVVAVSVSNDQRVKSWRISDTDKSRVELMADIYSGVADPGDVVVLDEGRAIMLAGVGLETWELPQATEDSGGVYDAERV